MQLYQKATTILSRLFSTANLNEASSSVKPFHAIPGPKSFPIIGNIWRYLPLIGNYDPHNLFENAKYNKKRYGPIVREQITSKLAILHLFDPNDIEFFFRHDGKYPHRRSHRALLKFRLDRPQLYNDGGLFPENGPCWYRQRNQFQKRLMSKSQISSNLRKLDKVSLKTLNRIETNFQNGDQGSHTIKEFESILYRWALASSVSVFLDFDVDHLDESFVEKFIEQLHNSLAATAKTEIQTEKWNKNPNKCPFYRTLAASQEFLHEFASSRVAEFLSNNAHSNVSGPSFLRDWLSIDKVDQKDVVSFIIDALMAGLHTTTYTIAFLLYHVANSKEIQSSLREEINARLPLVGDEPMTINQVEKLSLLRDCLKETLRMNPVSIGTGRLSSQDNLVIRNYQIPKDTMIITQNQAIGLDETIYTEPDQFKPERWKTYRVCPRDLRPSPFATLPFGFGARSCIGRRLVELQIKVMTARLLQRYEVKFNGEIPVKTTLIHNIGGHISVSLKKPSTNP